MRQVVRLEPVRYAVDFVAMRGEGVAGVLNAASQAGAGDASRSAKSPGKGLPVICGVGLHARAG